MTVSLFNSGLEKATSLVMIYGFSRGRFLFRSLRPQRRRQTRQRLFTLPKQPADEALSTNGNIVNAGDTGFAG